MTSRKGTQRELYIAEKFKKEGYVTIRKYASIGSYDFIGFRKGSCEHCGCSEMVAIQVKGSPWELTDEARDELIKDAKSFGARPVWVYRETRKGMLGLTKEGKQRTQARWVTVYLDKPYLDFTKAVIMNTKSKQMTIRKFI